MRKYMVSNFSNLHFPSMTQMYRQKNLMLEKIDKHFAESLKDSALIKKHTVA